MMNYIWVGLVFIAVVAGAITGTMEGVLNNIFDFARGFRTLRKAGQSHRTGNEKAVPGSSG